MRLSHGLIVVAALLYGSAAQAQTQSGATISGPLELTAQQRASIYQSVSGQKVRTPPPPMQLAIGADVPPVTELYAMPDSVTAEIPATKVYRYTMVQNQVVIVDPTTLKVVEILRQ